MYLHHHSPVYSPSDLALFMQSPFAAWMEHWQMIAPHAVPACDPPDSLLSVLSDQGAEHEAQLLARLSAGRSWADMRAAADPMQATRAAMQAGVEVIYQACLGRDQFIGYADFLIKIPLQSHLGDYAYEVWDSKLAKTVKPEFCVQLAAYVDMLEAVQGVRAPHFVIVLGDGSEQRLRTDDYFYYYQSLRNAFLQQQQDFDVNQMPDPAAAANLGRWQKFAEAYLQERDHLSLVATITRSQIKKLNRAGIDSLTDLVNFAGERVRGLAPQHLARLREQAAIQLRSRDQAVPHYQILPHSPGVKMGLALLPPADAADVFFDIEGFPLVDGGLEYLWGATFFNATGARDFRDFWAHDADQEARAFADFIGWVYARWQANPRMHIYHYANYEIAACRKLMGRYGRCEHEVDQLLRNQVFVDLYKIVKASVLLGEPRYSIKNVEHLYRPARATDVGNGADSVVVYERWRQAPDGDTWESSAILRAIRDYNIDDCNSTQELVDWLRLQQTAAGIDYLGLETQIEAELSEEITARVQLRDQLLTQAKNLYPSAPSQARLTENLAWSLEFHRREAKPVFWKLFDRLGLGELELIDDVDCLAACTRSQDAPFKANSRARNFTYLYHFDKNQEYKFAPTTAFYLLGEQTPDGRQAKVTLAPELSNFQDGVIALQAAQEPPARLSLIPDEYVNPNPIPEAIAAVIAQFRDGTLGKSAIVDFLQRHPPRITGLAPGAAIVTASDTAQRLAQIIQAVRGLDHSYLPIQGPPGAGKTFTGKHLIAALLQDGKRIGISSNSHKAINNLLIGTADYCREQGILAEFSCTKNTDETRISQLNIAVLKNAELAAACQGSCVLGTTAWGFARDDMAGQLDYLFVDEAGQVAVANLIAMSRAAKNLVLMGDQMQLGQPAQGSHPADSGMSVLDYLLRDTPTIGADSGIFLDTTYRMHSAVNHFISTAIYDSKLHAHPSNDRQVVKVPADYRGPFTAEAGLLYLPVIHEGNTQASDEEVAAIAQAAQQLIGREFIDKQGHTRPIGWDDMLFVAPYNFQVNKLKAALGEAAQVGSVDKFQGQEAPIVFFSLCASDANESPRGLDFLLNKNRINVAISRAQALAIIVGNPALVHTCPNSLAQMRQVNLLCQLLAMAYKIE